MIEYDVFRDLVPKHQRRMVTPELVEKLNEWNKDPKLLDSYKENLLSYIGVLKEGKFKLTDYTRAVKYVSYKMLGFNDLDAYAITFPERYQRLSDEGLSRSDMSPYASAYKKNKIVNAIMEQTLIPSHVINAPLYQEALNQLAQIMVHSRSDMARVNAANAILSHTQAPEVSKIELDIGVKGDSAIDDLRKATEELVLAQKQSILAGTAAAEIAETAIVDVDIIED